MRTLTVRHCNDKGIYRTYKCINKRVVDELQERRGRKRWKMREVKRSERKNKAIRKRKKKKEEEEEEE